MLAPLSLNVLIYQMPFQRDTMWLSLSHLGFWGVLERVGGLAELADSEGERTPHPYPVLQPISWDPSRASCKMPLPQLSPPGVLPDSHSLTSPRQKRTFPCSPMAPHQHICKATCPILPMAICFHELPSLLDWVCWREERMWVLHDCAILSDTKQGQLPSAFCQQQAPGRPKATACSS